MAPRSLGLNCILVNDGRANSATVFGTRHLDEKPLVYSGLQVELFEDGVFKTQYKFDYDTNRTYISPYKPIPGHQYTCKAHIRTQNGEERNLSASTEMPVATPILNVSTKAYAGYDTDGRLYSSIDISFPVVRGAKKYYEILLYRFTRNEAPILPKDRYQIEFLGDLKQLAVITDPVLLQEGLPLAVFSSEHIQDSIYTMHLNFYPDMGYNSSTGEIVGNLRLFVNLRSLSYEYYLYRKSIYLYEQGRFSSGIGSHGNPSQIYSNVKNGYGIVAAFSLSQAGPIYIQY